MKLFPDFLSYPDPILLLHATQWHLRPDLALNWEVAGALPIVGTHSMIFPPLMAAFFFPTPKGMSYW